MEKLQQRFWRLALVNVVSNLMVPLASSIDVAFLGHLADIHHLGGVAIATVLFTHGSLIFFRSWKNGILFALGFHQ